MAWAIGDAEGRNVVNTRQGKELGHHRMLDVVLVQLAMNMQVTIDASPPHSINYARVNKWGMTVLDVCIVCLVMEMQVMIGASPLQ